MLPLRLCHVLQVDSMDPVGSVEGSDVIIVDDMIDTAGTLCKAAEELKRRGGACPGRPVPHPPRSLC